MMRLISLKSVPFVRIRCFLELGSRRHSPGLLDGSHIILGHCGHVSDVLRQYEERLF